MKKIVATVFALVLLSVLCFPTSALAIGNSDFGNPWFPPPPPYCTISYDGNGNTSGTAPVDSTHYFWGCQATVQGPGDLEKEGWNFIGWKDGCGNSYQPGDTIYFPHWPHDLDDINLTAQWEIKEFNVEFRDWDGTVLDTQTVPYEGAAVAPANPSREHYTFIGWDKDFSCVTEDLIVTAQYKIDTFHVAFWDWDGTVLSEQIVPYGSAAVAPANPTRFQHIFTGWDKDFSFISRDMVILAEYKYDLSTSNTSRVTILTYPLPTAAPAAVPVQTLPQTGQNMTGFMWMLILGGAVSCLAVMTSLILYKKQHA